MSVEVSDSKLHAGTVTFLFTDIQGSTKLLQILGEKYTALLSDQRQIIRRAFENWDGREIDTQGDAFFASFPRATQAVAAVVEIQRALAAHNWPEGVEVQVRMGLHTGEPWLVEEGYVGMDVHRAARIAHIGHGGQVLLSDATAGLVKRDLAEGISLKDLGEYQLKDLRFYWHIYQLEIKDLPAEFPALKARQVGPPAELTAKKPVRQPAFLGEDATEVIDGQPVFVARQQELERLDESLEKALSGLGQVVFISGGAGRGKTALMGAFARRAMTSHPNLLVASGQSNAYTGAGEPYLPFRDVLAMLTGDVETRWTAGAITTEQARRSWAAIPAVVQYLIEYGASLVDAIIPGRPLLARAEAAATGAPWLIPLQKIAAGDHRGHFDQDQAGLFGQFEGVLRAVSKDHPLLLTLDDLQWADSASLNLLFHLGQRLAGERVMILGDFRPEEVTLGRDGGRHPLEKVLAEFKRQYGDVLIELGEADEKGGKEFINAFLDTQPNRLSAGFGEAFYHHTQGHPLFTVELLRNLQERGDLFKDDEGFWIDGPELNWGVLPSRVEGVIGERIGRLTAELQEILSVASIEGEDFTAQIVARVKEIDERDLVRQLSGELDKVHRLVGERRILKVAGHRLYLYSFQHHLFQKYIYNRLGKNEREILHAEVGRVLEGLYGEQCEEVAGQLAWHFSEAGQVEKAIHYLLLAGDRARLIYAYQEAIAFYQRAIMFLKEQGDFELAARTLMKLGLTHHAIFDFQESRQAYDEAFSLRLRMESTQPAILEPAPHPFKQVYAEPPTLDPTIVNDDRSNLYIANIFSGLVELGTEYEIIPDVAQSWEISEDGRRYLFHLRDDVRWSDGVQVTAADFEFALKRTLDPAIEQQGAARLLYDIKSARAYNMGEISDPDRVGARAIDTLTLEVELEQPASYFLYVLTSRFPVPRHVVEAHGDEWTDPVNLVSNGPFQLESYQPGGSFILARYPAYHGRFSGNLQEVEIKQNVPILSPEELARYESDDVDIAYLSEATIPARHRYVDEFISEPQPGTIFVGFETSRPPFDDLRVRRAFVMAVDRERLADEVLGGFHYPATGGLVPPAFPGHSSGIALPYDPDQARQFLAQAGYPEGRGFPILELVYYRLPKVLEYLKAQWSQNLNLDIPIEIMEFAKFIKQPRSRNLLCMGWTADYPDPDSFLRVCVRKFVPHWRNEPYERLLEGARRTSNQGERIPSYQAADKILIKQAAIMPITYFSGHWLVKPWVKIPEGYRGFRFYKNIILEPH